MFYSTNNKLQTLCGIDFVTILGQLTHEEKLYGYFMQDNERAGVANNPVNALEEVFRKRAAN
jgi:hypothetical protein